MPEQDTQESIPDSMVELTDLPLSVRLALVRNQLTAMESKVAAHFEAHPEAVYQSITEVVERSGLSYGSIMRFCRKIGCSGFQDFKVMLARDLPDNRRASEGDGPIERCFQRTHRDLESTRNVLDESAVHQAAKMISRASTVLIGGVASSAPSVISLDWKLSRIGIRSMCECESYVLAVRSALLGPDDLLVIISSSGATKSLLDASSHARDNGTPLLAITNFAKSPLSLVADCTLRTASDRDPISAEVPSEIAVEFVLDVLFEQLRTELPGSDRVVESTFKAIRDQKL